MSALLFPATKSSPVLWGALATIATITVLRGWDAEDNHKYLLCYWLWAMCIAYSTRDSAFRDRIILFNARFLLIFIFLGAALQKFVSSTYMSGQMFEMALLLDNRFHAFSYFVGIDGELWEESLRRWNLLRNPFVQVIDNYITLASDDHVRRIAKLVTLYDLYVQVAIGALLLFRRRSTEIAAHILLLFFIFTTYIPAPVFGFGFMLSILGFVLVKDRYGGLTVAYLLSAAAVVVYQVPWRTWVFQT